MGFDHLRWTIFVKWGAFSLSPISNYTCGSYNFSCMCYVIFKKNRLCRSVSSFASLWAMHFVVSNAWMNLKPQRNLLVVCVLDCNENNLLRTSNAIANGNVMWAECFVVGSLYYHFSVVVVVVVFSSSCCEYWLSHPMRSSTEKRLSTQFIFALHTRVVHGETTKQHWKFVRCALQNCLRTCTVLEIEKWQQPLRRRWRWRRQQTRKTISADSHAAN